MITQYSLCAERLTMSRCPDVVQLFGGSSLSRKHGKKASEKASREARKATSEPSIANQLRIDQAIKRRNTRAVLVRTVDGLKPLHFLSSRSAQKLRLKFHSFYRACGRKKTFVTLTFIQPITDRDGQAVLNKFLTALRKQFPTLLYIWVAERQDNGNIHFHVLVNQFLPVERFNGLWLLQQYNSGLKGKTKDGKEITIDELKQAIKDGYTRKLLNPFDVKAITTVNGLSLYLASYVTKTAKQHTQAKQEVKEKKKLPGTVGFDCLVWHCSREISKLATSSKVNAAVLEKAKSLENYKVDYKTGEMLPPKEYSHKWANLVFINNKELFRVLYLRELDAFNKRVLYDKNFDGEIPTMTAGQYYHHSKIKWVVNERVNTKSREFIGIGYQTKKYDYERKASEQQLIEGAKQLFTEGEGLRGNSPRLIENCIEIQEGGFKGTWYEYRFEGAIRGPLRPRILRVRGNIGNYR